MNLNESEVSAGRRTRKFDESVEFRLGASENANNYVEEENAFIKRQKLQSMDLIANNGALKGSDLIMMGSSTGFVYNDSGDDTDDDETEQKQPNPALYSLPLEFYHSDFPISTEPPLILPSGRKSRRKPVGEIITSRSRWTDEMDARLKEGFAEFGNQWKEVANHVGFDKNPAQCHKRWTWYINPALESRTKGPWSEEEVEQLKYLVEQNNLRQTAGGLKDSVNWTVISKELNREYYDCKNKYKLLLSADMKKGSFTEQEDSIISQRVIEWGSRGNGLWAVLEKELNRRSDSVKARAIKLGLVPK